MTCSSQVIDLVHSGRGICEEFAPSFFQHPTFWYTQLQKFNTAFGHVSWIRQSNVGYPMVAFKDVFVGHGTVVISLMSQICRMCDFPKTGDTIFKNTHTKTPSCYVYLLQIIWSISGNLWKSPVVLPRPHRMSGKCVEKMKLWPSRTCKTFLAAMPDNLAGLRCSYHL